jgi:ATP-binding cassette subfamily C protein LapB
MDEQSEARAIEALSRSLTEETTLIVVTHKPVLLNLVERLVVLLPGGGLMDGPKDAVLAQLRQNALRSIDSQKERRA